MSAHDTPNVSDTPGVPEHDPAPGQSPRPGTPPEPASALQPLPDARSTGRDDRLPGDSSQPARKVVVRGSTLGGQYVRISATHLDEFRSHGPGVLEATEQALAPHSRWGRMLSGVRRVLIGPRLATSQQLEERLPKYQALALLSGDAISSVAYGPEAGLAVLMAAGAAALRDNLPIAGCIALLMLILGFSYWQTIHAYPHGGGSYIVARENLGELPGLVAAAALMIDYVLVVAVSVASGVAALATAVPAIFPYTVPLGVALIVLMMLANLRGVRQSGAIFAAPTYLFVGSFLLMIAVGVVRAISSPGGLTAAVTPVKPPAALGWAPTQLSLVLILTAFASGCSAMTGIEALANGVPVFRPPEARNAARTLAATIAILVVLYSGITYLAWRFGIQPNAASNPTVTGQIAGIVFRGPLAWFYYVVQLATLLYLVLAANTSFSDFPRLASILARDGYLPHQFSRQGDRLAFSTGIIVLSLIAILLFIVFAGSTDALINLFALGVFTAFTLSQTGMVVHWRRQRQRDGATGARNNQRRWQRSMAINLVGAVATLVVVVVITFTKFDRGAWIVVVLVPSLVLLLRSISRHYVHTRRATRPLTPTRSREIHHIGVVPIGTLDEPALQALAYARSITPHVVGLHVAFGEAEERAMNDAWQRYIAGRRLAWERRVNAAEMQGIMIRGTSSEATRSAGPQKVFVEPRLVTIESPYRSLVTPLVEYIHVLHDDNPDCTITVVLPEYVPAHWWERLLHNQTALRLKLALYAMPGVVVANVPYRGR
jgi:amino acid transporter